jgi:hypothetical protein
MERANQQASIITGSLLPAASLLRTVGDMVVCDMSFRDRQLPMSLLGCRKFHDDGSLHG